MKQNRLNLYTVNMKYVRNLSNTDSHVYSVSPQTGKSTRPFLGIIVICDEKQYCIPLSSPKPRHEKMKNDVDFTKIYDSNGTLIGVLNFNIMIPVRDDVITPINVRPHPYDSAQARHYKKIVTKQLDFCRKNQEGIVRKANKLYRMITEGFAGNTLRKRCCNFKKLEEILNRFEVS